ncbi:MAG: T9SS type A sorting domain-containing protein [Bacteroidia bacterium]|nr:T9SS type A sorting domain-containing protein [Bacteroidota bacterium]MBP6511683.1 T9SS type A sorting domain-containing protein [Bacteroidia bacterium]MBP7244196.1 T9SS type A sorting domain-containing protein [Bacteroidia bacterium]
MIQPKPIYSKDIRITDLTGRICGYSLLLENEEIVSLALSDLSASTYFVQLQHASGVITKQLVIE